MKGKEYDVDVECPKCKAKLIIYDYTYYSEFGKDTELEWNCSNGCVFEEEEGYIVDEVVNRAVSRYINGE